MNNNWLALGKDPLLGPFFCNWVILRKNYADLIARFKETRTQNFLFFNPLILNKQVESHLSRSVVLIFKLKLILIFLPKPQRAQLKILLDSIVKDYNNDKASLESLLKEEPLKADDILSDFNISLEIDLDEEITDKAFLFSTPNQPS